MSSKDCVFCKIAHGQDEKTTLLYQDEKVVVFRDIRPAAEHHYLICPREHVPNAKCLTSIHIPFVENLLEIGKQVLREQNADLSKARFGFHWPPFCAVHHLHLHAISPEDGIRTFCWVTGMFSPGMPWFKSVDWVIERLRSLPSGESAEATVVAEAAVTTRANPDVATTVQSDSAAEDTATKTASKVATVVTEAAGTTRASPDVATTAQSNSATEDTATKTASKVATVVTEAAVTTKASPDVATTAQSNSATEDTATKTNAKVEDAS